GAVGNRFGRNVPGTLADLLNLRSSRTGSEDSVDEPMMQKLAEMTGGQYFRATDTDGLAAIYKQIDRLETTPMEGGSHTTYKGWLLPLVVAGVVLLALEQLLATTRFLRIP